MNKTFIIAIGVIVIAVFIILMGKWKKKRAGLREMRMHAQDKIREDALNQYILNPVTKDSMDSVSQATPFQVEYQGNTNQTGGSKKRGKHQKKSQLMVQIVEKSELSSRSYMFDARKGISIGSKAGENDIVITDKRISSVQCNIIMGNDKLYVKNVGVSGQLILQRGNQSAYVEKKMIELKSKDRIILANTILEIDILKA